MRIERPVVVGLVACLLGMGTPPLRAQEYELDLSRVDTRTVTVEPGSQIHLRLVNRLPLGWYRAVVLDPYGKERVVRVDPPTKGVIASRCVTGSPELARLLEIDDEAELPTALASARDKAAVAACSDPNVGVESFLRAFTSQLRAGLLLDGILPDHDRLKVRIERRRPGDAKAVRTWSVTFQLPPLAVAWRHATETAWVVRDVALHLAQLAGHARHASGDVELSVEGTTAGSPPVFRVMVSARGTPIQAAITLNPHAWAPEAYADLARKLMGNPPPSRCRPNAEQAGMFSRLADLRATRLESENQALAAWLERAPDCAAAYDAAAFVVGTLAFREAAGPWSDTRLLLSRMTALLAFARALDDSGTPDRSLAEALLATLVGRQSDALSRLDAISRTWGEGEAPPGYDAWVHALRVRNTGSWRLGPGTGSLVERLQMFRAFASRISVGHALAWASELGMEATPDWGRIGLEWRRSSVEDGHRLTPSAVPFELGELTEVWKLRHGRGLGQDEWRTTLALRPGRLVASGGTRSIEPLDDGTWAFEVLRHLRMSVDATGYFLDKVWGVPEQANEFSARAHAEFGDLPLFRESQGAGRGDTHRAGCDLLSAVVADRPEDVALGVWTGNGCTALLRYLPRWFMPRIPYGTTYEAARRLAPLQPAVDDERIEELHLLAPFDRALALWAVNRRFGDHATAAQAREVLGAQVDFDRHALQALVDRSSDVEERLRYMRQACEVDGGDCVRLGGYLLDLRRFPEAAEALQAAVNRSLDRLGVAGNVFWLTQYYLRNGRTDQGLAVAGMAADVYSYNGLETMAMAMEYLGRFDEALDWNRKIAERYDQRGLLDAFYVRYARLVGDGRFTAEIEAAERAVFPTGVERVGLESLSGPPLSGLQVDGWDPTWTGVDLKEGDILVALDGYRLRTDEQLQCIRRLRREGTSEAILWNGERYRAVTLPMNLALRRPELRVTPYGRLLGGPAADELSPDAWVARLESTDSTDARRAEEALKRLGGASVRALVEAYARSGPSDSAHNNAAQLLTVLPASQLAEGLPYLAKAMSEGDPRLRSAARLPVQVLAAHGEAAAAPVLAVCLDDPRPLEREACASSFQVLGSKAAAVEATLRRVYENDESTEVRRQVGFALYAIEHARSTSPP